MAGICLALLALGLILLTVEIFMPGFGVFGISGLGLMVVSAVLAVLYVPFGWAFVLLEALLLALLLYLMFSHIKKKQLQGKLIMNETLNEALPAIADRSSFLGKEGAAVSALRPFGEADFNGVSVEVTSDGVFIDKGKRIKVIDVSQNKITVKEA